MKNKVLIIGAYGNLGQELVKVFSDKFIVTGWDKDSLDITSEKEVEAKISNLNPDIIINAAAYNAVDKCEEDESEFELAKKINGQAVFYLAEMAKKINATFVHYSTDYVFDGKLVDGYDEDSIPNPISNYGKSKLLGEEKIKEVDKDNNLKYYLIRTSKLFGKPGISEGSKMSFFDTMIKVSENKKELKVVDAEVSNFTYTLDLAKETLRLIENNKQKGIYHITNSGSATWYEAAKFLFKIIKKDIKVIKVGSNEFPRPALRPNYSVLLNTKLREIRSWRSALYEYVCSNSLVLTNMKGIILAGGRATRLRPCTKITSKQLLPVYNKPMIYYPLNTLIKAGIKDILIIVAPERAGDFLNLLGSGSAFGVKFTYEIQDSPKGLAEAFIIGEKFIGSDNVTMILGDNIFEDDFSGDIKSFKGGAKIFAKKVSDPGRFGVVKFNEKMQAEKIEEKPKEWISDYAITGLYIYDNRVIEVAKKVLPSERGELEITSLHNWYLEKNDLEVAMVNGEWLDAGTFDSLLEAQILAKEKLQHKMII